MQLLKLPLIAETSDQLLHVDIDNRPFVLRVMWNERFGYFSLSVLEADKTPIVQNIKMVTNYPLVKRFADVRLPRGDLYFVQDSGKTKRPEYSDLGTTFSLYYFEADVIETPDLVRQVESEAIIGTLWDSNLTTWDAGSTVWDN